MKELRRIAIVCFEDPRHVTGGVQRRVAAEIAYFAKRGVHVTVISAGSGEVTIHDNVHYVTIPTLNVPYPARTLLFSLRTSRFLRRLVDLDLIETHHDGGAAVLFAHPFRRDERVRWIEVVHGVFRDELVTVLRYERRLSRDTLTASGLLPLSAVEQTAARRADAVIAVSCYAANLIARCYRVSGERIHVVPNGVDVDRFTPARVAPRRRGGPAHCNLLYVGRLHARKGVIGLLRAFARAHAVEPGLRLTLVGDGPLRGTLEEQAGRFGVSDAIRFLGSLPDDGILAAYREADVMCVPSLQEGQGIVALEAQACGIPVLATRAGGLVEAVKDGQSGLLVQPGDDDALADAMVRLARCPHLRGTLGQNAAAWARQFTWDRMLFLQEQLYCNLLEDGHRQHES